ncbi:MAG: acyl-CoA thioesterase [Alphaproteobacteria bacterium]|nr:acyl-CoA thioesterase [Alphaproteobacteria bacterium]
MSGVVSTIAQRVQFGDCDPARIVYYPNYFRWCDVNTHTLFEKAGLSARELADRFGVHTPIVDAHLEFRTPAKWGDDIEVRSEVSRWGSRSLTVSHRISHAGSGDVIAEGHTVHVCVRPDPETGKIGACEVPQELRDAFEVGEAGN